MSFEPFSAKSATVRPGRVTEKKEQDNIIVTKVLISLICREAPTGPIWPKCYMVGYVRDLITCAKFQVEIFMGYNFTEGRIFDFSIDFCMGLTTVQR